MDRRVVDSRGIRRTAQSAVDRQSGHRQPSDARPQLSAAQADWPRPRPWQPGFGFLPFDLGSQACACGCRGPASCEAGPTSTLPRLASQRAAAPLDDIEVLSRFAREIGTGTTSPDSVAADCAAQSVSMTTEQTENLLQQPSPIKRFAWSEKTWPASLQPKMPTTAPPCPIGAAEILRSRHARSLRILRILRILSVAEFTDTVAIIGFSAFPFYI